MNIVTALNRKYVPYTGTMLLSHAINEKEHIYAYLLHSELDAQDISLLEKTVSGYDMSIHPIYVDKNRFSARLPRNDQWSIEAYYRLMMLELLPDIVDRALYLDGDMIINKSLCDLYYSDFEEAMIIACDDKSGLNTPDRYGSKHNEMFRQSYECGYRYFNSGVMLLNINKMRERYSFQTYLDAIESWNYQMEAPDQDILNWVHWREVAYADCMRYDLFARVAHNAGVTYQEAKEGVAIIHYAGTKPWDNDNIHFDIERLWWDYAKMTPFYEQLLTDFVESAMTDKTVELFIKDLVDSYNDKRKSLDNIMVRIRNITGTWDKKTQG